MYYRHSTLASNQPLPISNAAREPIRKWKLKVIRLLHGLHSVAAQGKSVHNPGITQQSIAPDGTVAVPSRRSRARLGYEVETRPTEIWRSGQSSCTTSAPSAVKFGGGGLRARRLAWGICTRHQEPKTGRSTPFRLTALTPGVKPSHPA